MTRDTESGKVPPPCWLRVAMQPTHSCRFATPRRDFVVSLLMHANPLDKRATILDTGPSGTHPTEEHW